MSFVAIILIVVSAVLHAAWNLFTKTRHPTAAFFLIANLTGTALLLPLLARASDGAVWRAMAGVAPLLLATGFFMAIYYAGLAGAYRAGDVSVAYPLARAVPVLLVTAVSLGLGRRTQISPTCVAGVLLVVSGCFLLPMQRFSQIHLRHYLNPTCALALVAALGTTGYSLVDDAALRGLRGAATGEWGAVSISLLYLCLDGIVTSLWLLLFILPRRDGRQSLREAVRGHLPHAIAAGIVIYAAYALILFAMAHARNISYVVAFRQLSIPLGAVLGIVALREPAHRPKLAGVAIMFAGLLLVALG